MNAALGVAFLMIGVVGSLFSYRIYKYSKMWAGIGFFAGNCLAISGLLMVLSASGWLTLPFPMLVLYVLLISGIATHTFYRQIYVAWESKNKPAVYDLTQRY